MKFQRDIFTVSSTSIAVVSPLNESSLYVLDLGVWGGVGATWNYKFTESACDQAFSAHVESEIPTEAFFTFNVTTDTQNL
jgi:hypothetical protein